MIWPILEARAEIEKYFRSFFGSKENLLSKLSDLCDVIYDCTLTWFDFRFRFNTPVALAHDKFHEVLHIFFFRSLGDIRDLVGRISQAAKDRDESLHQVASLKRQNDQLLENTVGLEEKLSTQKKKSRSFEDQLRKVELKVAHSDASLADQVIK